MRSFALTPARNLARRIRRSDDSGAALVEFALVLPFVLLLLFAMLDFGKAYNYCLDSNHLASEGARWAVVNKNPGAGSGTLQEYIRNQADTDELKNGGTQSVPSAASVEICFPNGTPAKIGDPVRVTVSTTYHWLSFLSSQINLASSPVKGSATMRLEQVPTNYTATACTA